MGNDINDETVTVPCLHRVSVPVKLLRAPQYADLPVNALAFVQHTDGAFKALVVDMDSWRVHSVVTGQSDDFAVLTRKLQNPGSAICTVSWNPEADVVFPGGGGGGKPIPPGGGAGPGHPTPLLFDLVRAFAYLSDAGPRVP